MPHDLDGTSHKSQQDGHLGIDTRVVAPGAGVLYEEKVSVMNRALIDLGMGSFQWKIFAMTGFGWFVDNVSENFLSTAESLANPFASSGCRQSRS